MKKHILFIGIALFAFFVIAVPAAFGAGIGVPSLVPQTSCYKLGNYSITGMLGVAINAIKIIWGLSGSLALLMFVWGGFQWLTSGGEEDPIKKGRDTLINASIGIILIFGSWTAINYGLLQLGADKISANFSAACLPPLTHTTGGGSGGGTAGGAKGKCCWNAVIERGKGDNQDILYKGEEEDKPESECTEEAIMETLPSEGGKYTAINNSKFCKTGSCGERVVQSGGQINTQWKPETICPSSGTGGGGQAAQPPAQPPAQPVAQPPDESKQTQPGAGGKMQ